MTKNWEARERKLKKRTTGMRRSGDSVFVMRDAQRKRDERRAHEFLRGKKGADDSENT